MHQLQVIFKRLKKPSVLISVSSQIVTILLLLNVYVDVDVVSAIITGICSILVLLGIVSDPETQNKGYGDDLIECSGCHHKTRHIMINGKMVCTNCGCENRMVLPHSTVESNLTNKLQ